MEGGHIPPNSEMDYMDIDEVLVIPDTPERLSNQHKNACNENSMSTASNPRSSEFRDRGALIKRAQSSPGGVHNTGGYSHSFSSSSDIIQRQGSPYSVVPSSIFRNGATSRTVVLEHQGHNPSNKQHWDDEKNLHSRSVRQSHNHEIGNDPVIIKHGELGISSTRTVGDSSHSTISDNICKIRIGTDKHVHYVGHPEKRENNVCKDASEKNTCEGLFMPSPSIRLPRKDPRKRLVRNGCISPQNVAKANQSANSYVSGSANALPGASNHVIDVNEVIKDNATVGSKGKGVFIPTYSSKAHEDSSGCFAGQWRKGKLQETYSISGQDNYSVSASTGLGKCSSSFTSTTSEPVVPMNEDCVRTPSTTIKKHKKHVPASSSPEVICLSSGGESSAKKSTVDSGVRPKRLVGSPSAFGELSPEVSEGGSQTEARAIQVQLDEILARELQEQLYNEMPAGSSGERHLQLNRGRDSPRGSHNAYGARAVPASSTQRQSQSVSFRNRPSREGTPTWFPPSSITRFRNHSRQRSSLISSEEREVFFPPHMDLDMRMELLEALEEAFDDDIDTANHLLDSDREFNENDYEMLSALDENNHEHLGASDAQINSLPESAVHNDSSEACSICLETPEIGDTMRHLPCLHKYHKDCIDPWLRRKRCCPVCKSDI